jgi:PAS domain-containing protein
MPASWLSWEPSEGSSEPFLPTSSSSPSREDPRSDPGSSRGVVATLCRISRSLSRPSEYARFMLTVCEEIALLLQADSALVALLDPTGNAVRLQPGYGPLAGEEGEVVPLQGTFMGYVMQVGGVHRSQDIGHDARVTRGQERNWAGQVAIAMPLQHAGRTLGCLIALRDAESGAFNASDANRLTPVAEVVAAGLETIRRFDTARGARHQLESGQREADLRAWKERYDAVSRASRTVLFEWDFARNTLVWGDSYEEVFGSPPSLKVYPLEQWLGHLHPDDHDRVRLELERSARGDHRLDTHARVYHANGDWHPVLLREFERLPGPDGTRLIGAVADQVAMREDAVGGTERERRARSEATSQVVQGLRHEINNPLAVVLGQAQLLRREAALRGDPTLGPAIDAIFHESQRIQALVQQLTTLEDGPAPEPILKPRGGLNLPPRRNRDGDTASD